jgi:hypothetical protein
VGDSVQFLASFSDVLAAIKITGGGNGMRIQLDIPEDEMGNAAHLLLMRQKVLKVTIEVKEEPEQQGNDRRTTY